MNCNASTVSRKAEGCAVSLGLLLRKRSGLWTLYGDAELLQAERHLHQRYRLAGYGPLRLDVSADVADLLASPPGRGWISGGQRHFNSRRPLELLEQRITDGWICSFCEELPQQRDSPWRVLEIARLPLHLLAHKNHPLLNGARGDGVDVSSLRSCPCLALPDHCQPRRQSLLRRLGLANQMVSLERHDPGKWDTPLEDQRTIRTGTPFDLLQHQDWRALALPLDHQVEIGLVIREDLEALDAVQELHQALLAWSRQRLSEAAGRRLPASPGSRPEPG
jgi:hypothetical protein